MFEPWRSSGEEPLLQPALLHHPSGTVTLLEGWTFCISDRIGNIVRGSPQGLFLRDIRLLSSFNVLVNGHVPHPLGVQTLNTFSAVFISHVAPDPGRADATLIVFRHRYIGDGMREDIFVKNFGDEPATCDVEVALEADFASIFEVKESRCPAHRLTSTFDVEGHTARLSVEGSERRVVVVASSEPAATTGGTFRFRPTIGARSEWSTCVQVSTVLEGEIIEPTHRCGGRVEEGAPARRRRVRRSEAPVMDTENAELRRALVRSTEQLEALRLFDPDFPERAIVAAGAPWFMTVFGRDSLLTAWMALIVDPALAHGVLRTLARFQGEEENPATNEEPGRILHELRFGDNASLSFKGGNVYYGSIDSTPLFVMLLGELQRWGLGQDAVAALLPNVDRAMDWIETFGDGDGDGYVEYARSADNGLENQGWKDSWDALRDFDGRLPVGPIALCEVQGYVYSAYLARAYFAMEAGDDQKATRYQDRAVALKRAFNRDFWLEDRSCFAVALDGNKRPVDVVASNMGHCLWTGIVDEEKAAAVAKHLLSDDMFSGWGVRTLASSTPGYNPFSYHAGSVWPHDNALIAAGLMRYGFEQEAQQVILGMIDAAGAAGGELPELFSGLERGELPEPIGYPTSCSPQAWAAASPLLFLRTLLRFDPWIPHGKVWLAPALPPGIRRLQLERVPLAGHKVRISVEDAKVEVDGLPPGIELVPEPRRPVTALGAVS